jgi:AAA+ superfamily predicted ATPase
LADVPAIGADLLPPLRRLDTLLSRAVERTQELVPAAPGSDPFRGLYLAHDDIARSLTRNPGEPLGVEPLDLGAEPAPASHGRLDALASAFALSSFDVDLLVIALAPEIDLRYERIYAYLQDDVTRRRPSVDLALGLLCGSAQEKLERRVHLTHHAPLVRFGLLHVDAAGSPRPTLLARPLVLDEQVVAALLGIGGVDGRCAAFTTVSWPQRELDDLLVGTETRGALQRLIDRATGAGTPQRLVLHGRNPSGQYAIAEAIAGSLRAPLVGVNVTSLLAEADVRQVLRLVFRERWLRGAVLVLEDADSLDAQERPADAAVLAAELSRDGGIVVICGRAPWRPPRARTAWGPLGLVEIPVGPPDEPARGAMWRDAGVELAPADLHALAERFVLTEDQIREAAASAFGHAATPTPVELFAAARNQSAQDLGKLASKIAPSVRWSDLVLPDEAVAQLRELSSWVVHRQRVLREWGFGRRLSRGRGATALFTGGPGTGKTLAAEVVAGELGLDLYRIDLSGIVSKYIGETEKNLDRIFRAAENANAVMFFDEADALFGKRSEVRDSHDRYANIEISYLLQKMESYEGVAILATNLRDNLDQAFVRRLAFIVSFPFPEEDERRRIWDVVWPTEAPLSDDLDLNELAAAHRLSGGQIKNVSLAAAYLAASNGGVVAREHLEAALRREYEKSGRASTELELVG